MRILSFRAFCQIDQKSYRAAYDSLIVAQAFNKEIFIEKMSKFTADLEAAEEMIHKYLQKHNNSWHSKPLSELEGDILYLKRIDWILTYHCALCEYMQRDFGHAQEVDSRFFYFLNYSCVWFLLTAKFLSVKCSPFLFYILYFSCWRPA